MKAATQPRQVRESARLLIADGHAGRLHDSMITALPDILSPGDLLVVNDAATIPASFFARSASGARVEIRLLQYEGGADWRAVFLGAGDWHTATEYRPAPEKLEPGSVLKIADDFAAEVIALPTQSSRLAVVRFSRSATAMWTAIYTYGKVVQYSHLRAALPLWSVQTAYAGRPWSVEMPSAGAPLNWAILLELKRRGTRIASLTHAAGLSAVGEEALDRALPFSEQFEIPQATVDRIEETRGKGGRIVAVGTTVVRALEGSALQNQGKPAAGKGQTGLVIDRGFRRQVVDGILSGMHEPGQSHFRLLSAFADESLLEALWQRAENNGYLSHEFGDLCLILADPAASAASENALGGE